MTAVATVAKAKGAKQSMIAQAENIRCVSLEGKARALPIGRNRTGEPSELSATALSERRRAHGCVKPEREGESLADRA